MPARGGLPQQQRLLLCKASMSCALPSLPGKAVKHHNTPAAACLLEVSGGGGSALLGIGLLALQISQLLLALGGLQWKGEKASKLRH